MRYTDLIFDLYGTLVDIHTEETAAVWEKTALFFGFYGASYTGPALEADFRAELARREAKAGQSYECFPDVPFEQVLADLFRARSVTEGAEALGLQAAQLFRISSIAHLRRYPFVLEALAALRECGCRLWLLTNAQRAFTAYELRALGLEDCFDGICISSNYGCRKPDSRFFRALLEEQRLEPGRCLMIGNDRQTDIAGAAGLGMDTLYLHTALTPGDQAPADPARLPGRADESPFEFEGDDWGVLGPLLCAFLTGKTVSRPEGRVRRVAQMTAIYERSCDAVTELIHAAENYRSQEEALKQLAEYYQGPLWMADFEAERAGLLPKTMNRGILTEDAIWDLLTDERRMRELLREIDQKT